MDQKQRASLRAAVCLRQGLANRREAQPIYLPVHHWTTMTRLHRQIGLARRRGWHRAGSLLEAELLDSVLSCQNQLRAVEETLRRYLLPGDLPSEAELFQQLLALAEDFPEVTCDMQNSTICVVTEPLTLEGIELGPFEIQLRWNELHQSSCYSVVAVEPHPAESDSNVTHPHVRSNTLCEGDGRPAIQAALRDGRLEDFFALVWRVLSSYGSGSAFVELDKWESRECQDCGDDCPVDECNSCPECTRTVCDGCFTLCPQCQNGFCAECIECCACCKNPFCRECLGCCQDCGKSMCSRCGTNQRCPECRDPARIQREWNQPA